MVGPPWLQGPEGPNQPQSEGLAPQAYREAPSMHSWPLLRDLISRFQGLLPTP